jgi:hypothetical protein
MREEEPRYMSYLLRLWQTEGDGGFAWRISLEKPHDGERTGFASLAGLCTYLVSEMGENSDPPVDAPSDLSPIT